jgi:hypothetical protein
MRRTRRVLLAGAVGLLGGVVALGVVACGSRTGLLDLETEPVPENDAAGREAGPVEDAGDEAGVDAKAPGDATMPHDASHPPDASHHGDAAPDAEPPVDATLPPIDATPPPVIVTSDCPDADATVVYVVTEEKQMLAFNPADGSFRLLGTLSCPTPNDGFQPFSMAVDREGRAYVLYDGVLDDTFESIGALYRVSLATLACTATSYVPSSNPDFTTFGMGFSTDLGGPTEQLYVADEGDPPKLGAIDTTTFALRTVADLDPMAVSAELTGTGDGRLFGFFQPGTEAEVGQIDKTTGQLTGVDPLPGVDQGAGWAFGFWGGNFYLFTSPTGNGSDVTRFNPADRSVAVINHYPGIIVGAGVSTCAPVQ